MTDFSVIKVACFDFDDTLCIHKTRLPRDMHELMHYFECSIRGEYEADCTTSQGMREFLLLCQARRIAMGLISATGSYPTSNVKVQWVAKNYNVYMDNYCVGEQRMKPVMMQAVANAFGVQPHEVLFVDDDYDNLQAVEECGFQVCSPIEVCAFMETWYEEVDKDGEV